jgi:hypothetical protein
MSQLLQSLQLSLNFTNSIYLFSNAVSSSDYTASNYKMIKE